MIQKKYILISSLLLSGFLSFTSCDKNLDIKPTSELESVYFQTEERMQRGVGASYAALTNLYGPQLNESTQYGFWLLPGDDITADGSGNNLETFSGLNGSSGLVDGVWKRMYAVIARCNFMLEKIADPKVAEVYVTEGMKDANRGEMLFLRSYAFYKLWDWYRKAPIQDERVKSITDALLTPSAGFEMLDNAIASLEEAALILPDSWDSKNLGRITKDGANGLLVKCYVMRACYENKNAEYYTKAIAAFNKISSSRKLVKFGDNFDYRTENNEESLFEFQASHAPAQDNAWLNNDFGGDVGQMGAFYHYFDGHWGNYTSGIFGPTQKLVNAFDAADPRKSETLSDDADNVGWKLWWITPKWDKFNGYQMVKYRNGAKGDCNDNTWSLSSSNNPRILRFADVKLAVAEAYLATGKTTEALQQVNDIRERARKSTADGVEAAAPAALAAVTMNDIMNERFLELAGEEGHRWSDLRRWHAAGYINLGSWTSTDFGFPYASNLFAFDVNKNLLYPIPISELDRNPNMAASGNNPGY